MLRRRMRIVDIYETIQGEGKYVGVPMLFVRLGGCSRKCSFCDTEHEKFKDLSVKHVIDEINNSDVDIVLWTGGEPILQLREINYIIKHTDKKHHLESNGDIIADYSCFDYVCFSPKDIHAARRWNEYDKKIVTDLEINKELIPYATMLMPLDGCDHKKVIRYCIKNNIRYCPRIHKLEGIQ